MSGNLWWSASKAIKPILRKNPDTLSAASREAVQLFRLMAKEVPRVSNLYDVPMPNKVRLFFIKFLSLSLQKIRNFQNYVYVYIE